MMDVNISWDLDGIFNYDKYASFANLAPVLYTSLKQHILMCYELTTNYTRNLALGLDIYEFTITKEFYEKYGVYAVKYDVLSEQFTFIGNTDMLYYFNNIYVTPDTSFKDKLLIVDLGDKLENLNWSDFCYNHLTFENDIMYQFIQKLDTKNKFNVSVCKKNKDKFLSFVKKYNYKNDNLFINFEINPKNEFIGKILDDLSLYEFDMLKYNFSNIYLVCCIYTLENMCGYFSVEEIKALTNYLDLYNIKIKLDDDYCNYSLLKSYLVL